MTVNTLKIFRGKVGFNRRTKHFTKDLHCSLRAGVELVKKEALKIFANESEHPFEKVWNTYYVHSVPYITAAANLVSKQIAFSKIVIFASKMEGNCKKNYSKISKLFTQAETALKLNKPKEFISTDEILGIEKQFQEEIKNRASCTDTL